MSPRSGPRESVRGPWRLGQPTGLAPSCSRQRSAGREIRAATMRETQRAAPGAQSAGRLELPTFHPVTSSRRGYDPSIRINVFGSICSRIYRQLSMNCSGLRALGQGDRVRRLLAKGCWPKVANNCAARLWMSTYIRQLDHPSETCFLHALCKNRCCSS